MVRIKYRYLLVHILNPGPLDSASKPASGPADKPLPDLVQFHPPSPDDLTPQVLIRAIKDQVQYLYGDYGSGLVASSVLVKYFSPATSTAIVRCSRNHFRLVWAALTFMTHLPKTPSQKQPRPCVMQVIRVSGTIKKAEEEVIRRARAAVLRAKREGDEDGIDGLVGMLGEEMESGGKGKEKEKMSVVSDVSDEEGDLAMESDEDG